MKFMEISALLDLVGKMYSEIYSP